RSEYGERVACRSSSPRATPLPRSDRVRARKPSPASLLRSRVPKIRPPSTFLVRVEDVVPRRDGYMARVSAILKRRRIGGELVRCEVVVEHRVSPAAGFRKSLAILLHHE